VHKRTINKCFSLARKRATLQQAIAFNCVTKNNNFYCHRTIDIVKDEHILCGCGINYYVAMGFSPAVNNN